MRRGDVHEVIIGSDWWSCLCGDGGAGLSEDEARVEGGHHVDYFINNRGERDVAR